MNTIKTTSKTVYGEQALRDAVQHIIGLSCWFEVEPEPFDRWTITVKDEIAHIAFKGL